MTAGAGQAAGPSSASLHVQPTVGPGSGQLLDGAPLVNTSVNSFDVDRGGLGHDVVCVTDAQQLIFVYRQGGVGQQGAGGEGVAGGEVTMVF